MSSTSARPADPVLGYTTYQPDALRGIGDRVWQARSVWESKSCPLQQHNHDDNEFCLTTLPAHDDVDGVSECVLAGWARRAIISLPGFSAPVPRPERVRYAVREVKGKGLGVVATEDIPIGALILAERPLLARPGSARIQADYARLSSFQQFARASFVYMENEFELQCARMPLANVRRYMALANTHDMDGSGPLHGICKTNSFGVDVKEDAVAPGHTPRSAQYHVVGDKVSRFNHSCMPNVIHRFDFKAFAMQIYAVRPIARGEELMVSYVDIEHDRAERQAALKSYAFECTCGACTNPGMDAIRRTALHGPLPKASGGAADAERFLADYEAAGLQTEYRYLEVIEHVRKIQSNAGNAGRAEELFKIGARLAGAYVGVETKL